MSRNKANDEVKAFENALAEQRPAECYVLRLFVAGTTPRSTRAIENIRAICEEKLRDRYDLEVIDILQHPDQASPEQIVVAPTLLKKLPFPVRRVIGDLSDRFRVLVGLDLIPKSSPTA